MQDYEKFSLDKFKEWIHDLLDGNVSVSEIYKALIEVIEEDINYYSHKMNRASKLLSLVQGKNDNSQTSKKDEVSRWVLPVEFSYVDGVEDYIVTLPSDLLAKVDWKEGDTLEWIPSGGGFILQKVNNNN